MKYNILKSRHVPNVGMFNAGDDCEIIDDNVAKDLLAQGVIEKPRAKAKPIDEEETK